MMKTGLREIDLNILEKLLELGGEASLTELRFATRFKHTGKAIVGALKRLRARGAILYVRKHEGSLGTWRLSR